MSRRLLTVLLSSMCLWTAIATNAQAAPVAANQTPASNTTSSANEPPLPPGPAVDIRKAQGGAEGDLGPGVIIASWVGAAALILWVVSDHDDDDSPATTGTH